MNGRIVRDWDHKALGTVRRAVVDNKGGSMRGLLVHLNDDARRRVGASAPEVVVPARLVFSIRREELTLACSIEEIRREGLAFLVGPSLEPACATA